ncbi:uncharacterized protein F4807DRAFT_157210 [Annulohypoxylon truncatum]|uniref:uncharacterized protein n=1 Tax=Annulohypoxylon truncatum TaxID=327061 RepID=UPI0020085D1A|nr:uncharacterized protein F4807DRAFT_157210 [Annulohypoxylon truncatum]KAI1208244.1 hypothetical protein F4807DRAFT_157210 [Annulohypoxylon truncatum]
MDWPSTETLFNDNHFGNFKYEPRSFKIVRKLYTDKELECWDIKSPRDLKQWIEKNRHLLRESYQDGTVAMLVFIRHQR